jgi:hypothetical protein
MAVDDIDLFSHEEGVTRSLLRGASGAGGAAEEGEGALQEELGADAGLVAEGAAEADLRAGLEHADQHDADRADRDGAEAGCFGMPSVDTPVGLHGVWWRGAFRGLPVSGTVVRGSV